MEKYPIKFEPQHVKALWGRETWLVSAYPSRPTVVANGPYAGRSLPEMFAEFGEELAGERAKLAKGFPLLVKVIEAKDRLSLQVHPNEETAKRSGGDPKSEMWYVLGGESDAGIFAGLRDGVGKDELVRILREGRAEEAVAHITVQRGDALFIPGGLVHTIGGGCRLYEVQQTSDTTWRLHDWNRIDPSTGAPRRTNEREALEAMDFTLPPPVPMNGIGTPEAPAVDCPYFRFYAMDVTRTMKLAENATGLRILFASEGQCDVLVEGSSAVALAGLDCALLPPGTPCSVMPNGSCRLLVTDN